MSLPTPSPRALFRALLITLLIVSLPTIAAQKGMWRWKDATGNLNYSDTPPKGVDAEFIASDAVRPGKMSSTARADDNTSETDPANSGDDLADKKMEVMPEVDPVLCEQAKTNLNALSDKPRIRITEADGSKRVLTPEEIEGEKDRARKFIDLYCPK
jgi:hypothetical protein